MLLRRKSKLTAEYYERPNNASSQQELYQLYGMLKDNIPFEEILKETYDDIEHYIDQFVFEDAEAQLILSNVSGEVEVKYFTEPPKIIENIIDELSEADNGVF